MATELPKFNAPLLADENSLHNQLNRLVTLLNDRLSAAESRITVLESASAAPKT